MGAAEASDVQDAMAGGAGGVRDRTARFVATAEDLCGRIHRAIGAAEVKADGAHGVRLDIGPVPAVVSAGPALPLANIRRLSGVFGETTSLPVLAAVVPHGTAEWQSSHLAGLPTRSASNTPARPRSCRGSSARSETSPASRGP